MINTTVSKVIITNLQLVFHQFPFLLFASITILLIILLIIIIIIIILFLILIFILVLVLILIITHSQSPTLQDADKSIERYTKLYERDISQVRDKGKPWCTLPSSCVVLFAYYFGILLTNFQHKVKAVWAACLVILGP